MKNAIFVAAVAGGISLLALRADALELTVAHNNEPGEQAYVAFEYLRDKINGSGVDLTMKVFPAGQAGSEEDTLEQVRIGALAMTTVASPVLSNSSSLVGVLDIPFLFQGADHAWAVIDGPIGKRINERVKADTGLEIVTWWGSGIRHVFTRSKCVPTPADLAGLKVRVIGSELYVDTFNALGAKATPLPYGEVYQALSTGLVSGAENESSGYRTMKFFEVAPYYTLTGHFFLFKPVLMHPSFLEKMTPEQRAVFDNALAQATGIQRFLIDARDKENLDFVKERGSTVCPAERDAYRAKLQPLIAEYTERYGNELVNEIRDAAPQ